MCVRPLSLTDLYVIYTNIAKVVVYVKTTCLSDLTFESYIKNTCLSH